MAPMSFGPPPPEPAPSSTPAGADHALVGGPPGGRLSAPPWGPAQVGLGLLVLFGISLVTVAIGGVLIPRDLAGGFVETAILSVLLGLSFASSAVLIASTALGAGAAGGRGVARTVGASLRALGLRRPRGHTLEDSILAFVTYFAVAIVIGLLLQPDQQEVTRILGANQSVAISILAGLLVCVVAPFGEEIFFRGFAFAGLRRRLPFWAAGLLANGGWALLHLSGGDWGVVVQLTAFGFALAWLYERSDSLWPCIGLHALNNGLALAVQLGS